MWVRACLVIVLFVSVSSTAVAQGGGRAGSWELGFSAFDTTDTVVSGEGGSSLDVDGDLGIGGSAYYNFTDRLALGATASWSNPDYRAVLNVDGGAPVTIDANLDVAALHLNGVFYFFRSDFTPYLEVGGGWTRVDSNIASGRPSTGCWWDPWWGYVCSQFFDTYHETVTSTAEAFGVRWDVTSETVLKLSWSTVTVNTSRRAEDHSFDLFRAEFAWKF